MILSKPKSYKPKMAFHSQHINLLVRGELVQNTAISSPWTQFSTPIPLWLQERREVAELKQLTLSSQISPVPAENLSSEDVIQGFGSGPSNNHMWLQAHSQAWRRGESAWFQPFAHVLNYLSI